jgi:hypothetical protein
VHRCRQSRTAVGNDRGPALCLPDRNGKTLRTELARAARQPAPATQIAIEYVVPDLRNTCDGNSATISPVKNKPSFTRRKLSAVVRKAITSYYTEHEQKAISEAAKRDGISMSSFVAAAALARARRLNARD